MTYSERNNISLEELMQYSTIVLTNVNAWYNNEGCRTYDEYKEYKTVQEELRQRGIEL